MREMSSSPIFIKEKRVNSEMDTIPNTLKLSAYLFGPFFGWTLRGSEMCFKLGAH